MNINPSQISNLVTIKQNDTARILYDDLKINGVAIDLSGSAVTLVWRDPRSGITERKAATVQVAASGSVLYSLTPADLATAGSYILEWEIVFPNTTQLSVPTEQYIKLNILDDLDT